MHIIVAKDPDVGIEYAKSREIPLLDCIIVTHPNQIPDDAAHARWHFVGDVNKYRIYPLVMKRYEQIRQKLKGGKDNVDNRIKRSRAKHQAASTETKTPKKNPHKQTPRRRAHP